MSESSNPFAADVEEYNPFAADVPDVADEGFDQGFGNDDFFVTADTAEQPQTPPTPAVAQAAAYATRSSSGSHSPVSNATAASTATDTLIDVNPPAAVAAADLVDLERRELEVMRREAALRDRETALTSREKEIRASGVKANNWPFNWYAILYHSIKDEVPEQYQSLCKRMYALCLYTFLSYAVFLLSALVLWFGVKDYGISYGFFPGLYTFCGVVTAWKWWYFPFYKALAKPKVRSWVSYFVGHSLHLGFTIFLCIGIPGTASTGMFVVLDVFSKGKNFAGILCAVSLSLLVVNAIATALLLKKAHHTYRLQGMEGAVQAAVASAAVDAAVSNAMGGDNERFTAD